MSVDDYFSQAPPIPEVLKITGWTAGDLASKAGVSIDEIEKLTSNQQNYEPSIAVLLGIVDALYKYRAGITKDNGRQHVVTNLDSILFLLTGMCAKAMKDASIGLKEHGEFSSLFDVFTSCCRIELGDVLNSVHLTSKYDGVSSIDVIGVVINGYRRKDLYWGKEERYTLLLPNDTRHIGASRFALEVACNDMEQVYPEGTILVCVEFSDMKREPRVGERVICQHCSDGLWDLTVKLFQKDGNGRPWLVSLSSAPDRSSPIPIDDPLGDEDVKVTGLVVSAYKPE